ncbi:N-(5'-phosphoribosyl)anthranilate isomerase [Salinibacter sp. 10B]|uniref:phosphoribosylanthranilate isomerase n=1 Tax=Salinibacter sp. 10B TaxID=1923971 RepID=UPI000CF38C86|nr:phosphoribosylanthranilate isomerase [Salinibacter sp. 10B]PQJ34187.1 N-(5'-phosphoribosyl)anthranilate isomerase [Salinibacter sp. 10B]
MKLKVCGITELEDARYLAGAGADYLGFVQHEDSPRYAPPSLASDIIEWVHGPKPVGVFVNDGAAEINAAVDEAGFAFAQLHGQEPPHVVEAVNCPVIKAIHVRNDAAPEQLRTLFERYEDVAEYFLLDTHNSSVWGGTGESFNWRLARELSSDYPIFLAGGIDADNVQRAVETMRPFAIDLSSSLEDVPGEKSFGKIDAFFDAFRSVKNTMTDDPDS